MKKIFLLLMTIFHFSFVLPQEVEFCELRKQYLGLDELPSLNFDQGKDSSVLEKERNMYMLDYQNSGDPKYLFLLNNIAEIHLKNKNFEEATSVLNENLEIARLKDTTIFEYCLSMYNLAKCHHKKSNYNKGLDYAQQCNNLAISYKIDSSFLVYSYQIIAKSYFSNRKTRLGLENLIISDNIADKLNNQKVIYENTITLGNILTHFEPLEATKFLEYAVHLYTVNEYENEEDYAFQHFLLGASYMSRDRFNEAIENLNKAREFFSKPSQETTRINYILNFYTASCHIYLNQLDSGLTYLKFFEKNDKFLKESYHKKLGEIYYEKGDFAEAKKNFEKSLNLFLEMGKEVIPNQVLDIRFKLAMNNYKLNHKSLAIKQLRAILFDMADDPGKESVEILPSTIPLDNASFDYFHNFLKTYTLWIQNEYLAGGNYSINDVVRCYISDINGLNEKIFAKHTVQSKYLFSKKAKTTSMNLLEFVSSQGITNDSILLSVWKSVAYTKNNHFNSSLNRKESSLELNAIEKIKYDSLEMELRKLKFQISSLDTTDYNLLKKNLNCYKQLFALSFDKKANMIYQGINLEVDVSKCLGALPDSSAVIDYYLTDSNIFYFTYLDNKISLNKSKNSLMVYSKLNNYLKKILSGEKTNYNDSKDLLVGLGFSSVLKHGIKELTLIPDNKIANLPFEMLRDKKGKFLIVNLNLKYLYSLNQLIQKKETDFPYEITCFAPGFNNEYLQSLSETKGESENRNNSHLYNEKKLKPLPYSITECEDIVKLFEGNSSTAIFTNEKANSENFLNNLDSSRIVHIATHGLTSKQEDDETGIYLYDSINAVMLLSMDYIQIHKTKANLVVLSACESGIGGNIEGEGIMTLPRGFIFSGCQNVLATIWRIEDQRTSEFMLAFYTHLLSGCKSYSDALRLTKLEFIKKGAIPFDWAGFLLIGN